MTVTCSYVLHRPRASAPMGVPSRQQQRLQRLSMATDTDSAAPGGGNSNSSWLYTTTAAASTMRPGSAQVLSTHQISAAAAAKPKHKAFRPASAAAPASPNSSTAHPTGCNYSPDASHTPAKPAGAAQLPGRARSAGLKSVNITTSQAMHGLKDLYPDLWASTVPICRPDPAPNKNFISEWGESLRQGAGEAWKPYLATTSQLANLQVAKPVSALWTSQSTVTSLRNTAWNSTACLGLLLGTLQLAATVVLMRSTVHSSSQCCIQSSLCTLSTA